MAWCLAGNRATMCGGDSPVEFIHGLCLFQGLFIQISEVCLL